MGRFEKHLGKGEEVEIDGEKFLLKPLTTEHLPLFFKTMKAFSGAKEGADMSEILKNIDDAGLNAVKEIIEITLEKSFPNESEEERKQFGLKYMSDLIGVIFEMNTSGTGDSRKESAMAKIKARVENVKSIRPPQK